MFGKPNLWFSEHQFRVKIGLKDLWFCEHIFGLPNINLELKSALRKNLWFTEHGFRVKIGLKALNLWFSELYSTKFYLQYPIYKMDEL